ncbi:MAG: cupin [Ilumatobacteraceae bacterium]
MSESALVEIPCEDVAREADFFGEHGWRIRDVFPADDPQRITLDGHGLCIVVVRGTSFPRRLLLPATTGDTVVSPHGTHLVFGRTTLTAPELRSEFTLSNGNENWHVGRAGMHYRDLVPGRQGGAVIASHIRIPIGGPVPDYPHFHDVIFQLIFCHRGWVRLAYESQGEPFVLEAGECVIQPPLIRHRVLESSDDLHVVEVGYPAEHLTIADHEFDFAAAPPDPSRTWSGQRFVRFRSSDREWRTGASGAQEADTGIAEATDRRADVRLMRVSGSPSNIDRVPQRRFLMCFVLRGTARVTVDGRDHDVIESDSIVIPVGSQATLLGRPDAELLLVSIDTD